MPIIPTVRCSRMETSLDFHTKVVDFERIDGDDETGDHWGTREFYVNDADGNTLRFTQGFLFPPAR